MGLGVRRPWRRVGWEMGKGGENLPLSLLTPEGVYRGGVPGHPHRTTPQPPPLPPPPYPPPLPPLPIDGAVLAFKLFGSQRFTKAQAHQLFWHALS